MPEDESRLEKKVKEGLLGEPEIKKEEKDQFLGEFKERVIRYLITKQVNEPVIYPEILEALQHSSASKLIIDREVDQQRARDYIKLARKNDVQFKRVHSPKFKGNVALVVVSSGAVDVKKRKVMDRKERLQNLGISDTIIENVGAKLCGKCWSELEKKAPEELINYQKMNIIDKMFGKKCICQKEKNN
ncbi:MAG: DUF1694 domain-containing protein [Halanaerobiaceae bacterium]